jgi:hypothetical protein
MPDPRLRRVSAAVHPKRALDLLVPEVPKMKSDRTISSQRPSP